MEHINQIYNLILTLAEILFVTTIINCILMGFPLPGFSLRKYPKDFLIKKENLFPIQKKRECSAFASAYVLRHFGKPADGFELYKSMPYQWADGNVSPKGIRKLFSSKAFHTKYRFGGISSLKQEVSKGNPVIVFIRVYHKKSPLHFVPIVGYDKDYLYIAESQKNLINCNHPYYNRKVSIKDFRKLWNTSMLKMPLYRNIYIIIRK